MITISITVIWDNNWSLLAKTGLEGLLSVDYKNVEPLQLRFLFISRLKSYLLNMPTIEFHQYHKINLEVNKIEALFDKVSTLRGIIIIVIFYLHIYRSNSIRSIGKYYGIISILVSISCDDR